MTLSAVMSCNGGQLGGRRRNLAEILVFTTYLSATTSLLWTALPLLDLPSFAQ